MLGQLANDEDCSWTGSVYGTHPRANEGTFQEDKKSPPLVPFNASLNSHIKLLPSTLPPENLDVQHCNQEETNSPGFAAILDSLDIRSIIKEFIFSHHTWAQGYI